MLNFPGTTMQQWWFNYFIIATTHADLSANIPVFLWQRKFLFWFFCFVFFVPRPSISARHPALVPVDRWSWSRCRRQKGACGWPLIQTFPCLSHPALSTYRPTTYQALIICMRSRSRDHTRTRRLGHRKEEEEEHNHRPATDSCSVWCCSWRTVHLQTRRTLWICSNWSAFPLYDQFQVAKAGNHLSVTVAEQHSLFLLRKDLSDLFTGKKNIIRFFIADQTRESSCSTKNWHL